MLRIVIVGTGEMATSLLLGVKEAGHEVVGFFRSERVNKNSFIRGFCDFFAPTDFFMLAKKQGIYEIKSKTVNSEHFRKELRKLHADIVLVGTWGERFSQKTIDTPKLATINCHPSFLPKHRGPNPYMSTIVNGEENTGITFHLMDKNYDTGAILLQKEVPILTSDNGYTLKLRCVKTAREELKNLLSAVESGSLVPVEQNTNEASYFKRITPKDIYVDFSMTAKEIYNKVRGFHPWAFCYLKAKKQFLKIGYAHVVDLNKTEFFVKNKKYKVPDRYVNGKAGEILARGRDWLLCSTIEEDVAILLYDLKLFGFCKQIFTKKFVFRLKSLK